MNHLPRLMGVALGLALLSSAASAQIVSELNPPYSRSEIDALAASIPAPATSAPPGEMVGGAAGSPGTYRPGNAVQPRITRAGVVTTDTAGSYSITWSTPLSAAPVTLPIPMVPAGSNQPVICLPTTSTATGATGRCWYARTLPATLTLLGNLVSYDVFGAAATAIQVQVLAIPVTQ